MKELEEIYQEMLDCFAQRTGLEAGGELRPGGAASTRWRPRCTPCTPRRTGCSGSAFPRRRRGSCLDSHAQLRGLSAEAGHRRGGEHPVFCGEGGGYGPAYPRRDRLHDPGAGPVRDGTGGGSGGGGVLGGCARPGADAGQCGQCPGRGGDRHGGRAGGDRRLHQPRPLCWRRGRGGGRGPAPAGA